MKTATGLLSALGIRNATQRHIQIIQDYLDASDRSEQSVKNLLSRLGGWDETDLRKAIDYLLY